MKLYLPVVLVALVATLLHSAEYVTADSICPPENCLNPKKCDQEVVDGKCANPCDACCSVVKEECRTHCRHWGGECMNSCNPVLQHPVVDCPLDKVCCTLV